MITCIFKDRDLHKPYLIGRHIQYPPPLPSPARDLSSPKLTKCFLLNGGNVTDGMTPGFKQFTVNILVMKIISLHSDAKTAVNWVQLNLATRARLEDLRKLSSRIIGKHFTKVITFANSHLLKSKYLMSKVC